MGRCWTLDDVDDHWRIIYPLLNHINVGGRVVSYQLFGYRNQFPEKSKKSIKSTDFLIVELLLICLAMMTRMGVL